MSFWPTTGIQAIVIDRVKPTLIERLSSMAAKCESARPLFGVRPILKVRYAALVRVAVPWRGIASLDFEEHRSEKPQADLWTEQAPS
jgi:hypothetical protein